MIREDLTEKLGFAKIPEGEEGVRLTNLQAEKTASAKALRQGSGAKDREETAEAEPCR